MSEETSESQPTRLLAEDAPRKDNTSWIVAGIVVVVALLGCCLVAVGLFGVGLLMPPRIANVYQITSGPALRATPSPTPIFALPLDTLPPVPPLEPADVLTVTPIIALPPGDLFATPPTEAPAAAPEGAQTGTVVKVIDGDTIDVDIDGQVFRVRYIGINTPETGETCGSEATAANRAFVDGHQVTLIKDVSETDRYDRLLRYVYVGDTFVNAQLVRDGWAEAVAYPPDTQYADTFRELQDQAREQNVGCWPMGVWGDLP